MKSDHGGRRVLPKRIIIITGGANVLGVSKLISDAAYGNSQLWLFRPGADRKDTYLEVFLGL